MNFNSDQPILPTPEQILFGLIIAQINEYSNEDLVNYIPVIRMDTNIWKKLFELPKDLQMTKPLTPKILSNPKNKFVKTLVYIYSMETFVFKEMNKASRSKDVTKIEFYGAFAAALGLIVHHGYMDETLKDSL